MSIVTKKIGCKYVTKYNITFNFTYVQPPITGSSYVWTLQQNSFTVAVTDYTINSIAVTNASYTFNSSTGDLIIYDVVGNVVVTIAAVAKDSILCGLNIHGYYYSDQQGNLHGYWPASGTVTYINKYGQSVTLDLSTLGKSTDQKNIILAGTQVVCTNIALASDYGSPSQRQVQFYIGPYPVWSSSELVHSGPGTGTSYTYQNINDKWILITSSGY